MKPEMLRYPVRICCVLGDTDMTFADAAVIKTIREYTQNSGAMFTTRHYNSMKKSEDRDFIERLPAFHVYINKSYIKTFYPNTRPLQHVDESIAKHVNAIELKRVRSELWRKRLSSLAQWLKNLLVISAKQPLQHIDEDTMVDTTIATTKLKMRSVPDWN